MRQNVFSGRTTAQGERRVAVEAVWSGDPKKANKVLAPLRAAGKPIADTVAAVPYTKFQTRTDNSNRHGIRNYQKSGMVNDFSDALVDQLVEMYRPDSIAVIFFMQAGGTVARIAPTDTAYPHRACGVRIAILTENPCVPYSPHEISPLLPLSFFGMFYQIAPPRRNQVNCG